MQHIDALRTQLYNAVYGQDSIINGELIADLMAELERRSEEMLPEELTACRELVAAWWAMWFPKMEQG